MRWTIEPMTSADDLDSVMAIEDASFTNPWTRDMYLSELKNTGVSHFLIARDPEGRAVGFCAFWLVADELHINNLAVDPALRRQGIGGALLARAVADGRRLGAHRAFLEVRESNVVAQRLYAQAGFIVAGIRRAYYSQPTEDAVILQLDPLSGGDGR